MAVAGSLTVRIKLDAGQYQRNLAMLAGKTELAARRMSESFAEVSRRLTSLGGEMTAKLSAPIGLLSVAVIKMAGDFEQAMNMVRVLTRESGATADQFAALEERARALGSTTQFSASQVADAMTFMAMAGMEATEIFEGVEAVLSLAAAGGMEMAQAADIVTNIMSSQGQTADELSNSVNVFAKAFTSANTDLGQLGEAFKYAGPITRATGMAFEEATAALALMGNAGIQASMAGTSLRMAMLRLAKAGEMPEIDRPLRRLGVSAKDAVGNIRPLADILDDLRTAGAGIEDYAAIFDTRAAAAMSFLAENTDALRVFRTELDIVGDVAEDISSTRMEGLNGALRKMKSAFEGLAIAIGQSGLLNFMTGLAESAANLFAGLSRLSPQMLGLVAGIAGLAAALGPALMVLGAATWAISQLSGAFAAMAAMMASPLGIIALLALATVAFLKFSGALDTTADKVDNAERALHNYSRIQDQIQTDIARVVELQNSLTDAIDLQGTAAENTARMEIEAIRQRIAANRELLRVYEARARADLQAAEARVTTRDRRQIEGLLFEAPQHDSGTSPADYAQQLYRQGLATSGQDLQTQVGAVFGDFQDQADAAMEQIRQAQATGQQLTHEQGRLLPLLAEFYENAARISELNALVDALGQPAQQQATTPQITATDLPAPSAQAEDPARGAREGIDREIANMRELAEGLAGVHRAQAEATGRRIAVEQAFRQQLSDSNGVLQVSEDTLQRLTDKYIEQEQAIDRVTRANERAAAAGAALKDVNGQLHQGQRLLDATLQGSDALERETVRQQLYASGVRGTGEEIDALIDKIMEQRQAMDSAQQSMEFYRGIVAAPMDALKQGLADGTTNLGDVVRAFGENLRMTMLEHLVFKPLDAFAEGFANGLMKAFGDVFGGGGVLEKLGEQAGAALARVFQDMLGGAGGGGGLGGIFGSLFGAMLPGGGITSGTFGGIKSMGMKATGGGVLSGKPYLVGENGPELFMPAGTGRILNEGMMPSGQGGGTNISVGAPVINIMGNADENTRGMIREELANFSQSLPRAIDARVTDRMRRGAY